jgi:tRNA threonylcarbamoyl adenosine modification protein (Sua5/YciO/YrdC/YwlC family)
MYSKLLKIHPETPQRHLMRKAQQTLAHGGVIVYPTDSGYALGCKIGFKEATDRIRAIRKLDEKHQMTLICRDLSEVSHFAKMPDPIYRLLRLYTPGPYTFLLNATREVPKRLQHPNRKTIGIRIPAHVIAQALLELSEEPLLTSSLILPDYDGILIEPAVIYDLVGKRVDLVLDGGFCGREPTSLVDLTSAKPVILRKGKGDTTAFENL